MAIRPLRSWYPADLYGMEANIVGRSCPIVYNEVEMNLSEATYVVF